MRIRNVFLLFAMVGLPPVSQAQLSFGPEVIIDGTIASGSDIATTDFNNDGLLDLVVIEAVPGLVSQGYVYPGLQGAGFGPRVNLNISSLLAPVAVMVGDFAENGLADVLVIDAFFGDTLLFRNLGGFTFSSGSAGPSPGATADAVATDLNADGHVDFVAALPLSQGGRVYFGTGTGGFTAGPLLAALSVPLSVAVADMNGDTHLDVIFGLNAGAGGGITIRLNNGAAAWTANTFIPGPVGVGTMLPGDYDNDGNLDIGGTTTDANGVFLMLGNGAGSLAPPQILPAGTDPFGAAGADFDGDGNLDIVAFPGNSPHLRIFQGNGMGSLTAALTIPTSAAIRGVAADFDEDGDPDIVCVKAVGGNAGRVSLYSNEANPVVGGPSFNRGDANNDGAWNIADAIKILGFLFGGETIDCEVAGDANDDESLNVADAVYALTALFSSGPWFGAPTTCGEDPTPGTLSCDSFSTCP